MVLRVAEGSTHKEEEGHNFVLTYADIVEDILCMTLISDDELISSDDLIFFNKMVPIKLRLFTLDLGLRITLDLPIIKGNYLTGLKASGYDGDLRFVFALIGF